ncbi:sulfur-oxidizing protein SoxY [Novimethylophilus kurashikiensis]|uniref:Sulfur-oxidizing protein SoxY n=1 Tax=Novimethylophilus kurashikiensis TaxID=1825523 RepID=A0A2R5F5N9_9PROT|nr:thiosulfate oxidation carrier protein SoxY [Novimethylophilus kurashikiensis]GBG13650.1 sulfur-oxidizing protein SoxY [Novimethylophilus kurashikiensis]
MNDSRRSFIQAGVALLGLMALAPLKALAAIWNKPAFESTSVDGALAGLDAKSPQPSKDIVLSAPDLAENGAIVQIEVESRIPNTEAIAIISDKNPTPLIANFVFSEGVDPYVVTRIKMAETSELRAVVKAGGRYFMASRKVEVAVGGCG